MEKYKALICKVCEALQEAAKLTDNILDDIAIQTIHDAIDRYLSVVHAEPQMMYSAPMFSAGEVAAFPSWLLPFLPVVVDLVRVLLDQMKKRGQV